jgi:hypothetical protein
MSRKKMNLDHIETDLRPLACPIEKLKFDERQAKIHGVRSVEEIKRSLVFHGQKKPIVVERSTMQVKAGNGTLQAATELGWTHVAAVISDDADEELRQFALRDNRTAELSEWDADALVEEIESLEVQPEEIGFDDDELQDIIDRSGEDIEPDPDPFEEVSFSKAPKGMVTFKFGAHRGHVPESVYQSFVAKLEEMKTETEEPILGDVLSRWLNV